jgi:hypothetical protein
LAAKALPKKNYCSGEMGTVSPNIGDQNGPDVAFLLGKENGRRELSVNVLHHSIASSHSAACQSSDVSFSSRPIGRWWRFWLVLRVRREVEAGQFQLAHEARSI